MEKKNKKKPRTLTEDIHLRVTAEFKKKLDKKRGLIQRAPYILDILQRELDK